MGTHGPGNRCFQAITINDLRPENTHVNEYGSRLPPSQADHNNGQQCDLSLIKDQELEALS